MGRCPKQQRWGPRSVSSLCREEKAPGVALVGGWVTSLPGGPAGGHQGDSGAGAGRPADGQPFFLDILHRTPTTSFPGPGARRPAASADHFSELIRGTFLEEVPMGMVDEKDWRFQVASLTGGKNGG